MNSSELAKPNEHFLTRADAGKFISVLSVVLLFFGFTSILGALRPQFWNFLDLASSQGEKVGMILFEEGLLRHRAKRELSWREIHTPKTEARVGDVIFTGESSFSTLDLDEGSSFFILSSSLVVVEKPYRIDDHGMIHPGFRLEQGRVKIKFTDKIRTVAVRINDRTYLIHAKEKAESAIIEVDPADPEKKIRIRTRDPKLVEISLFSDSSVSSDENRLNENVNDFAQVEGDSPLEVFNPPRDSEVVHVGVPDPIRFKWEREESAKKYKLEVGKQSFETEKTEMMIPIKNDGIYKWNVTPLDANGENIRAGSSGSFTLREKEKLKAPVLQGPAENSLFQEVIPEEIKVKFSWNEVSGAVSYELVLLSEGGEIISKSNEPDLIVTHLKPGQYRWSVRSVDSTGRVGITSLEQSIVIQQSPPPLPPEIISVDVEERSDRR